MAFAHDPDHDLPWLAFRYVSGELGPDEAEAFERRLDQDQAAREAVAEAVELAGAVAALSPVPILAPDFVLPTARRPLRKVVVGVLAVAAAACLAWVVVTLRGPAPTSTSPAPEGERNLATGKIKPSATVTLAWSKLRQGSEEGKGESYGPLAWNDEFPGPSDSELPAPAEAEEASDHGLPLPLWLLDAASLAGRPGTAGSPAKER